MPHALRHVVLLALLLAAAPAFAVTAEELAARNVEAHGGSEALHAVHDLRLTGKLRLDGGARELGLVTLVRPPTAIRYEAQLQGLTQIQAYDGTDAWQVDPFQGRKDAEKLSTDDGKALGEDAADFLGVLVDYKAKGYTLDYLGIEDVEGTAAHKLRVTRTNGDIVTLYLDPDYFLEIRSIERRIEHGAPRETVTDFGDYEKVGGITMAFAEDSGRLGSQARQKVQYEHAEINVSLDPSVFRFPVAAGKAAPGP